MLLGSFEDVSSLSASAAALAHLAAVFNDLALQPRSWVKTVSAFTRNKGQCKTISHVFLSLRSHLLPPLQEGAGEVSLSHVRTNYKNRSRELARDTVTGVRM
jgi:hypothetical protein